MANKDVLKGLTKASPLELLDAAHVLDADAPAVAWKLASARLRLSNYWPGEIDFDASAPSEAVIVIAHAWIPGWKAYVDGQATSLFRVNHTQIGIHLPKAGTFHIRLAYEPSYRLLNDILAAPTRLMPVTPQSQPSSDQLSIGDLPPICASTNTQEG